MKRLAQAFTGAKDPLADFKLAADEPAFHVGHQGLWTARQAVERGTKQPVTVLTLADDDVCQRVSGDPAAVEEVVQRAASGMRMLARLRHPSLVRVVRPLEEEKVKRGKRRVVVVERILRPLTQWRDAQRSAANAGPGASSGAARGDLLDDVFADSGAGSGAQQGGRDTLDAELGLCNVAKGMAFLHDAARIAHLNVAPGSIVLCPAASAASSDSHTAGGKHQSSDGLGSAASSAPPTPMGTSTASTDGNSRGAEETDWRILDLSFAVAASELDAIPPAFCTHFADTRHRGSGGGSVVCPLRCPTLNFSAPSYVQHNRPHFGSDLWSFGCLVHWALNADKTDDEAFKLDAANDLMIYDRVLQSRILRGSAGAAPSAFTATDFFSGGPAQSAAPQSSSSVLQDVTELLAADGGAAEPLATRSGRPFVSFDDFLQRSVLHSQRAKTITQLAALATLEPSEKLGLLQKLYKLVPQLSGPMLSARVVPRLTEELADPRMFRFVTPIVLAAIPRLSPEQLREACTTPLLLALRSDDVHVRTILVDEFAALETATAADPKISKCTAEWLSNNLAARDVKAGMLAKFAARTVWAFEHQPRYAESVLLSLLQLLIASESMLAGEEPDAALALIKAAGAAAERGVATVALPVAEDVVLSHALRFCEHLAGRRGADAVALRLVRCCIDRVGDGAVVRAMEPLARTLSAHRDSEIATSLHELLRHCVDRLAGRRS